LKVIAALHHNNRDGAIHSSVHVIFSNISYICLCIIKIIVLAPSSICFLLSPHNYLRVLSCICVLLVAAMHAWPQPKSILYEIT